MAEFFEGAPEDETQNFLDQLGALTPEQREQMTNEFASFVESWVRWRYLPRAKQYVRDRILSNGNPVTTDANGVTRDLKNTSIFDTFNFIGNTVKINSSNARQADIQIGGGGADCLFNFLVSSCFATLPGFSEGEVFTSLSGCTFKGYSTIQGAVTQCQTDNGGVIAICAGTYTENVSVNCQLLSGAMVIIGAGVERTTNIASSTASATFSVAGTGSGSTMFSMTGMTFASIANQTAPALSINNLTCKTELHDVWIKPAPGTDGVLLCGTEIIANHIRVKGQGSGASRGKVGMSFTTTPAAANGIVSDVFITDCTTGFSGTGASNLQLDQFHITNAITGMDLSAGGLGNSQISNGFIDICTTGIGFGCGGNNGAVFSSLTFNNCNTAMDLSAESFIGGCSGITSATFSNIVCTTSTASFIGIQMTGANPAAIIACAFVANNFRGYTSGNEIKLPGGTFGTGTYGAHNTSDNGMLADFGSPIGHAGSGSGGAASNADPFVTIGAVSDLSAERALTGDTAETFTDGGANSTVTHHSIREIVFVMDGGGSTLATGVRPPVQVPFNCTINSWNLCGDAAGTCTVDLSTATDAATPSFASIVGAGTKPNVAGPAVCSTATAPASWTSTAITAGQLLQPNLTAVTAFKTLMLALKVTTT